MAFERSLVKNSYTSLLSWTAWFSATNPSHLWILQPVFISVFRVTACTFLPYVTHSFPLAVYVHIMNLVICHRKYFRYHLFNITYFKRWHVSLSLSFFLSFIYFYSSMYFNGNLTGTTQRRDNIKTCTCT